jgi:predicted TPR repeat methyltransferase
LTDQVEAWIGVDLSAGMLREARRRQVYARLVEADVVDFLADEPPASADLVAAADLLPYLGDIRPLFAAVARVLVPGGRFIATAEEAVEGDVCLRESRRFAHAGSYLREALAATDLTVRDLRGAAIRRDRGDPVKSLILLAERKSD